VPEDLQLPVLLPSHSIRHPQTNSSELATGLPQNAWHAQKTQKPVEIAFYAWVQHHRDSWAARSAMTAS